ncbi:related to NAR1 - similarity to human nuclear prelamin A recognition factor [Ustilago trichophora]|uniref:Cytosolic Fe-S cluster assembly factor NAR1 n=1 Tax=Ustilago trichophora TaxID=86804 RepID=A0A5C3E5B2_9BASI|nr:related to NAR1 - similarity to human nuclear prelamin A recognition factor [Ustilago trichophora]
MAFSGALTLTDLNDYLGPSQACIKPVEGADAPSDEPNGAPEPIDPAASASTQIAIDHDGSYYESAAPSLSSTTASASATKPRQRTKLETAEISLNDCLACSGCVTSAESVLITMQSQEELRRAVTEINESTTRKLLVASISTQSLASLSAKYTFQHQQQQQQLLQSTATSSSDSNSPSGSSASPSALPLRVLLHRISYFLKTVFQFDHVYDTTFSRHIALKEHEREFFQRRANSHKRAKHNDAADTLGNSQPSDEPTLPMLASACPGWICYAEKTHGELLPYVSTTKSPQQVAGVIAKRFLPERLGLLSGSDSADTASIKPIIYHVTVMPCYDKKLEASRPDFYDDITNTKEVDCVLTTGELDKLMLDEGFDICSPVPGEQEAMQQSVADLSLEQAFSGSTINANANAVSILPHFPQLLDQPGSSSGGYLFNLMRAVWLDWISQHWDQFPESIRERGVLPKLDVRVIRTADFTEYVLRAPIQFGSSGNADTAPSSSILFRGAQCYGFRNLQNLVRKLQKQTGARNTRGAAARLVDADGNAVGAGGRNRAAAARARARGRGGMVRRGRGGAAAVAGSAAVTSSSPLNPDADAASVPISSAQEEEERGYDYVEVMACPSGCVNGGGQIRPPTQSDVDATQNSTTANGTTDPEGYAKGGWAAEQSSGQDDDFDLMLSNKTCSKKQSGGGDGEDVELDDGIKEKEIKGWQGTSKEWVRRVEEAYWQGSRVAHTPVNVIANHAGGIASDSGASTPTLVGSGANTPLSSSNAKSIRVEDHQRLLESLAVSQHPAKTREVTNVGSDTFAYADVLAELVVKELSHLSAPVGLTNDAAALDKARDHLFRTQYRAVQDEAVNGLAVQW